MSERGEIKKANHYDWLSFFGCVCSLEQIVGWGFNTLYD